LSALPYAAGLIALWGWGHVSDKVGRRAPFVAGGFLLAGISLYYAAYVPDNMTSVYLISIGMAGITSSMTGSHSILQSIVPTKSVGAATGMMNGVSNALAALVPVLIGYIIGVTGSYVGGLMFLVGCALFGSLCMMILAMKKY
jgi:MFS family permease